MTPNFSHPARESIARTRADLASEESSRLKFAALELPMAVESVTYERAQSYKEEIPPSEYRTWQPKKLMQVLVDIKLRANVCGEVGRNNEQEKALLRVEEQV